MSESGLIYVITGDKGVGKSTVCALVAHEARDAGWTVAGIVTERETDEGPSGIRWVTDLRSGERHLFGSRRSKQDQGSEPPRSAQRSGAAKTPTSDPLVPDWDLDSTVFTWANAVLAQATPCDLLVVDEVGPLELVGGRGWTEALTALRSRAYAVALVVCRPGLVGELGRQLGAIPTTLLEVTSENRGHLPSSVAARVLADSQQGRSSTKPGRTT